MIVTKKKWLYIIGIIVLAVPILFFYNAFNGNPVTQFVATKSLEKHLVQTYPADEFNVKKPFYDFKMGGYTFEVLKIGDAKQVPYEFLTRGALGTTIAIDGIYDANQDRPLIIKLENQAREELTILLQEKVPEIREVEAQLEVLKGTYDSDAKWSKDFKPEKPMRLYVTVDIEKLEQEDILRIANIVQTTLNESNYDYNYVNIDGNVYSETESKESESTWYVKYAISFEKDTILKLRDIEEYK